MALAHGLLALALQARASLLLLALAPVVPRRRPSELSRMDEKALLLHHLPLLHLVVPHPLLIPCLVSLPRRPPAPPCAPFFFF
jgi:hypothetical protein